MLVSFHFLFFLVPILEFSKNEEVKKILLKWFLFEPSFSFSSLIYFTKKRKLILPFSAFLLSSEIRDLFLFSLLFYFTFILVSFCTALYLLHFLFLHLSFLSSSTIKNILKKYFLVSVYFYKGKFFQYFCFQSPQK
jgi:hypothetical protein